ncbi:unnamed protein product [Vitrella brassicaformis CCMP3155]|uniref:Uncharacterized protein n=1 Tax=Vitrella brassicaformis (strain CCMP3155) TaxID=1169540 RepID=A0A0G4EEZ8_VITBC|nr:unnamed protein product [Vitrella brassicaformis CCMP3155]|eukprot:CEL93990.1 unnamed protein product [Vitrella brassicaformis CCMP3155]
MADEEEYSKAALNALTERWFGPEQASRAFVDGGKGFDMAKTAIYERAKGMDLHETEDGPIVCLKAAIEEQDESAVYELLHIFDVTIKRQQKAQQPNKRHPQPHQQPSAADTQPPQPPPDTTSPPPSPPSPPPQQVHQQQSSSPNAAHASPQPSERSATAESDESLDQAFMQQAIKDAEGLLDGFRKLLPARKELGVEMLGSSKAVRLRFRTRHKRKSDGELVFGKPVSVTRELGVSEALKRVVEERNRLISPPIVGYEEVLGIPVTEPGRSLPRSATNRPGDIPHGTGSHSSAGSSTSDRLAQCLMREIHQKYQQGSRTTMTLQYKDGHFVVEHHKQPVETFSVAKHGVVAALRKALIARNRRAAHLGAHLWTSYGHLIDGREDEWEGDSVETIDGLDHLNGPHPSRPSLKGKEGTPDELTLLARKFLAMLQEQIRSDGTELGIVLDEERRELRARVSGAEEGKPHSIASFDGFVDALSQVVLDRNTQAEAQGVPLLKGHEVVVQKALANRLGHREKGAARRRKNRDPGRDAEIAKFQRIAAAVLPALKRHLVAGLPFEKRLCADRPMLSITFNLAQHRFGVGGESLGGKFEYFDVAALGCDQALKQAIVRRNQRAQARGQPPLSSYDQVLMDFGVDPTPPADDDRNSPASPAPAPTTEKGHSGRSNTPEPAPLSQEQRDELEAIVRDYLRKLMDHHQQLHKGKKRKEVPNFAIRYEAATTKFRAVMGANYERIAKAGQRLRPSETKSAVECVKEGLREALQLRNEVAQESQRLGAHPLELDSYLRVVDLPYEEVKGSAQRDESDKEEAGESEREAAGRPVLEEGAGVDLHPDLWTKAARVPHRIHDKGIKWGGRLRSWKGYVDEAEWDELFGEDVSSVPIDEATGEPLQPCKAFSATKHGFLAARELALDYVAMLRPIMEQRRHLKQQQSPPALPHQLDVTKYRRKELPQPQQQPQLQPQPKPKPKPQPKPPVSAADGDGGGDAGRSEASIAGCILSKLQQKLPPPTPLGIVFDDKKHRFVVTVGHEGPAHFPVDEAGGLLAALYQAVSCRNQRGKAMGIPEVTRPESRDGTPQPIEKRPEPEPPRRVSEAYQRKLYLNILVRAYLQKLRDLYEAQRKGGEGGGQQEDEPLTVWWHNELSRLRWKVGQRVRQSEPVEALAQDGGGIDAVRSALRVAIDDRNSLISQAAPGSSCIFTDFEATFADDDGVIESAGLPSPEFDPHFDYVALYTRLYPEEVRQRREEKKSINKVAPALLKRLADICDPLGIIYDPLTATFHVQFEGSPALASFSVHTCGAAGALQRAIAHRNSVMSDMLPPLVGYEEIIKEFDLSLGSKRARSVAGRGGEGEEGDDSSGGVQERAAKKRAISGSGTPEHHSNTPDPSPRGQTPRLSMLPPPSQQQQPLAKPPSPPLAKRAPAASQLEGVIARSTFPPQGDHLDPVTHLCPELHSDRHRAYLQILAETYFDKLVERCLSHVPPESRNLAIEYRSRFGRFVVKTSANTRGAPPDLTSGSVLVYTGGEPEVGQPSFFKQLKWAIERRNELAPTQGWPTVVGAESVLNEWEESYGYDSTVCYRTIFNRERDRKKLEAAQQTGSQQTGSPLRHARITPGPKTTFKAECAEAAEGLIAALHQAYLEQLGGQVDEASAPLGITWNVTKCVPQVSLRKVRVRLPPTLSRLASVRGSSLPIDVATMMLHVAVQYRNRAAEKAGIPAVDYAGVLGYGDPADNDLTPECMPLCPPEHNAPLSDSQCSDKTMPVKRNTPPLPGADDAAEWEQRKAYAALVAAAYIAALREHYGRPGMLAMSWDRQSACPTTMLSTAWPEHVKPVMLAGLKVKPEEYHDPAAIKRSLIEAVAIRNDMGAPKCMPPVEGHEELLDDRRINVYGEYDPACDYVAMSRDSRLLSSSAGPTKAARARQMRPGRGKRLRDPSDPAVPDSMVQRESPMPPPPATPPRIQMGRKATPDRDNRKRKAVAPPASLVSSRLLPEPSSQRKQPRLTPRADAPLPYQRKRYAAAIANAYIEGLNSLYGAQLVAMGRAGPPLSLSWDTDRAAPFLLDPTNGIQLLTESMSIPLGEGAIGGCLGAVQGSLKAAIARRNLFTGDKAPHVTGYAEFLDQPPPLPPQPHRRQIAVTANEVLPQLKRLLPQFSALLLLSEPPPTAEAKPPALGIRFSSSRCAFGVTLGGNGPEGVLFYVRGSWGRGEGLREAIACRNEIARLTGVPLLEGYNDIIAKYDQE